MAAAHDHKVPLWALFIILVALTAAEVGFYEVWKHSAMEADRIVAAGGEAAPFIPKFAMVLVLLVVLTVPKALIVLIYFMHLKFEKQLILGLAAFPMITAAITVLPTLVDARVLKPRAYNQPIEPIGIYEPEGEHGHDDAHAPAQPEAAPTSSDYSY